MGTAELAEKIEQLSPEDFKIVVALINRLSDKPSNILRDARNKYVHSNPMTMEEIDDEIKKYREESAK